ncbi:MAG: hypothetical protein ACXWC8_15630 [Limisphaerales bacterium]
MTIAARVISRCFAFVVVTTLCSCANPINVPPLPTPPQQHAAWTPVGEVSSNLLSITRTLFDQGLPDPRGCEYREVEVSVSSVWGHWEDSRPVKTHGWIIPTTSEPKFVLCWNTVIYKAVKIGALADLERDVLTLPTNYIWNFDRAFSETRTVLASNAPPQAAFLLLRLGKTDAAVGLLKSLSERGANQKRYQPPPDDAYLDFASDWMWSMFDHLISAHMRADVVSALSTARRISEVQPLLETEAAKRGFKYPPSIGRDPYEKPKIQTYFNFLVELPRLAADLERRANEGKTNSVIDRGLSPTNSQSHDIKRLIQDLDMVAAPQWGQPGGVALEQDPLVQALIHVGEDAVDHLIACLETDKRLIRSVSFSRDFFRSRHVVSVNSAARTALQHILRIEAETPEQFRAYWSQNRGSQIEERWYKTLKSDSAGYDQWLQAAQNITQPNNIIGVPGSGSWRVIQLKPGEEPKMRGEPLRKKQNPSVTSLMAKRGMIVAQEATQLDQSTGVDAIRRGVDFLSTLNEWAGPEPAAPAAQILMQHAINLWSDRNSFIMSSGHDLARYIPAMADICINARATNALANYVQWLKTAEPAKMETYAMNAFGVFTNHLQDSNATATCDWLFNDSTSPWNHLPWQYVHFENPIESNLIVLPAFRQLLLRELANTQPAGSMKFWAQHDVIELKTTFGGGSRGPSLFQPKPKDQTTVNVRHCDYVAWSLSNAKRIPPFNPFESEPDRETAIAAAKRMINDWK